MSDRFDPPPETTPAPLGGARAAVERQLAAVEELTAIGLGIAQALGRRAAAAEEQTPADLPALSEVSLAYTRVSRAVRMSVMLQSRLTQELSGPMPGAHRPDYVRKRRVERILGRVIEAEHGDDGPVGRQLAREARERVEQDDLYGDVMTLPVSEIVARICKDLGLSPDWPRLAAEAWAEEEIRSGWPGAPLAALTTGGDHRNGAIPFRPPP